MLKFSLCSCTSLLTSVIIFMIIILNSLLNESFISLLLWLISRNSSCLEHILIFQFLLTLYVGFCTLDKTGAYILTDWPLVDKPHQSAQTELLKPL